MIDVPKIISYNIFKILKSTFILNKFIIRTLAHYRKRRLEKEGESVEVGVTDT